MMRLYAKRIFALTLSLFLFAGFGLCVNAAAEEVQVPIAMQIPEAIAGAEFEVSYTPGLKLLRFEKSEAVRSAATTPIVEKRGNTYFGFYTGTNAYAPTNGVLDVGYLVFEYTGDLDQKVTVTEAKYVTVIDKDTTKSEVLIINDEIGVPLVGAGFMIGKKSNIGWIIAGAAAVVVVAGAVFFLYRRKKLLAVQALQAAAVGSVEAEAVVGVVASPVDTTVSAAPAEPAVPAEPVVPTEAVVTEPVVEPTAEPTVEPETKDESQS